MNDLASTLEQITQREAGRKIERSKVAEKNRRDFPAMSKFLDHFTPVFGPCRVIYAEESGKSIGKLPEGV